MCGKREGEIVGIVNGKNKIDMSEEQEKERGRDRSEGVAGND